MRETFGQYQYLDCDLFLQWLSIMEYSEARVSTKLLVITCSSMLGLEVPLPRLLVSFTPRSSPFPQENSDCNGVFTLSVSGTPEPGPEKMGCMIQ